MVMINDVMVIYNDDDDDDGDDVDGYGDDDDDDNDGDDDWRGVGNDYGDDDDDDDDNYDDDDDGGDNDDEDIFVKFSQNFGPFIAKSGLFAPFWDFFCPPPSLRTGLSGWRMCSWEGLQFQTFWYIEGLQNHTKRV